MDIGHCINSTNNETKLAHSREMVGSVVAAKLHKILKKYWGLFCNEQVTAGCFHEIIGANLESYGCTDKELALQIRIIALHCVSNASAIPEFVRPILSLQMAAYCGAAEVFEVLLRLYDYQTATMTHNNLSPTQFAAARGNLRILSMIHNIDCEHIYHSVGKCNAYNMMKFCLRNAFKIKLHDAKSDESSRIYVCGDNDIPSLGITCERSVKYPVPVEFADKTLGIGLKVTQVSFAKYHTLFLIGGQVFSCGLGRYGRLGHGDDKDQLKARAIKCPDTVVCVAASLNHSIICTQHKVIGFGLNDKGQLGLNGKGPLLHPTVVKMCNEDHSNPIIDCSTNVDFSVIILKNFDFYVSGSTYGPFWHKYEGHTFKLVKNVFIRPVTSVAVFASTLVRISSIEHDTRGALFAADMVGHTTSCRINGSEIYIFNTDNAAAIVPVIFLERTTGTDIYGITSINVTQHGQILLTDHLGCVYEGILPNRTYHQSLDGTDFLKSEEKLTVFISRLRGILPTKSAFLAPDGRNKVLNMLEMNPHEILSYMGHHSEIELRFFYVCNMMMPFDEHHIKSLRCMAEITEFAKSTHATVICLNEDNEELGRLDASVEILKHESDYCASFFERWAVEGQSEIRVTAEPQLVEIFLLFCKYHTISSELSKSELFDLLIFADKLLCKNFLTALIYELFRQPFSVSDLRNLYGLARYLTCAELYHSLYQISAAVFPMLLESGFINELSMNEIANIEKAYHAYIGQDFCAIDTVDCIEAYLNRLVVPEWLKNLIGDLVLVVKKPMDIDKLVELCRKLWDDSNVVKKRPKKQRSSKQVVKAADHKNDSKKEPDLEKESGTMCFISDTIVHCDKRSDSPIDKASAANKTEESYKKPYSENMADEQSKRDRNAAVNIGRPQSRSSRSWNLVGNSSTMRPFAELVEEQRVVEAQTMRQRNSRISDIEKEEQALIGLVTQYESEANFVGTSLSICAERREEEVNDPLWTARS